MLTSIAMPVHAPDWAERHRVTMGQYGVPGDKQNGCFLFKDRGLFVIISSGAGWEHASVSRKSRMPTYDDMNWVARTFWPEEDCLMQLRVPLKDHVNVSNYCLHWWRPLDDEIPRPPAWMVG